MVMVVPVLVTHIPSIAQKPRCSISTPATSPLLRTLRRSSPDRKAIAHVPTLAVNPRREDA